MTDETIQSTQKMGNEATTNVQNEIQSHYLDIVPGVFGKMLYLAGNCCHTVRGFGTLAASNGGLCLTGFTPIPNDALPGSWRNIKAIAPEPPLDPAHLLSVHVPIILRAFPVADGPDADMIFDDLVKGLEWHLRLTISWLDGCVARFSAWYIGDSMRPGESKPYCVGPRWESLRLTIRLDNSTPTAERDYSEWISEAEILNKEIVCDEDDEPEDVECMLQWQWDYKIKQFMEWRDQFYKEWMVECELHRPIHQELLCALRREHHWQPCSLSYCSSVAARFAVACRQVAAMSGSSSEPRVG